MWQIIRIGTDGPYDILRHIGLEGGALSTPKIWPFLQNGGYFTVWHFLRDNHEIGGKSIKIGQNSPYGLLRHIERGASKVSDMA